MALNAYQQAVVDWAVSGTGHANVNALAGTGKTYTLEAIVAAVKTAQPNAEIRYWGWDNVNHVSYPISRDMLTEMAKGK